MRKSYNRIFFLCMSMCVVCMLVTSNLHAQISHLDCLKKIGISEGLTQSTVTSIFRDSKGLLWIGTRNGLNLYDRNHMIRFYCDSEDENSLPGNLINSIIEDEDGYIWIGTDGGLVKYSHKLSSFEVINNDNIRGAVRCGTFLVFGGSGYIYSYNINTGDFCSHLVLPENPFPDEKRGIVIKHICADGDNSVILAATNGRIYHLCLYDMNITRYEDISFSIISDVIKTSDGQLFVSSFKEGLFGYGESGQMTGHWTNRNSGLSSNMITDFLEFDGYLYCATDGGGISVMDLKTGTFQEPLVMDGNPVSLPTNSLTVLYNDPLGAFWAGTVRNGLLYLNSTAIHSYQSAPADRYGYSWGLSENCVTSFYEDDDGLLWLGTDGGGMNLFNPDTRKFRHLPEFAGKCVFSITGKDDATLLVSVYNDGVYEYSKQTGEIHRFLIIDRERDEVEQMSGVIPSLHKVSDRKILIFGRNIVSYNPKDDTFREISETVDGGRIPFSPVLLYSDKAFSYFVSAVDTVVYRISLDNNIVDRIVTMEYSDRISSFCPGRDGNYYVGTDKGLFSCYDDGSKYQIGTFHSVSYLNSDSDGRVWICSENHLYSMNNEFFVPWTASDGYIANDIFGSGQCAPKGNRLYLCGSNGLTEIEFEGLVPEKENPKLSLLHISVNGLIIPEKERDEEITVPFDSQLVLDLALTEKDLFREVKFRYTINHNGQRQTIINDTQEITMSMLSEGRYTVQASCLKKDGQWTPDYHLASIIVSPPWYRSVLAKTCYMTGIVIFVLLVTIYFIHKQKKVAQEQKNSYERIVQKRRIQTLVSMCHEIKTPLSLMYMPLKRLLNEPNTGCSESLRDIFHQTCHINDVINMVLEYDSVKTGNFSLALDMYDFNQWLEKQVFLFIRDYEDKGVKLEFVKSYEFSLVQFDERIIRIVFSNILSYMLKHSLPGSTVKVGPVLTDYILSVRISSQSIQLTGSERQSLSDGLESNDSEDNFGFSFCSQLMRIHQGTIKISTDPEHGIIFAFSIPFITGIGQKSSKITGRSGISVTPGLSEEQNEFCSHFSLMIIDDNQEFVNRFRDSILFCFKNIYTSNGGDACISEILNLKPDILIVNYQIHTSDSMELCKRIRENDEINSATIILMTDKSSEEVTSEGYIHGVDQIIQKPIDEDTLLTIIYNNLKNKDRLRKRYQEYMGMITRREKSFTLSDEEFVLTLNKLILNNLTDPEFSIAFLMNRMHSGRTAFFTRVRNLTGLSINDYINKMRITKAMNILTSTSLSVSEIADKVGCTSQSYFSTLFKKYTGTTPREYKRSVTHSQKDESLGDR